MTEERSFADRIRERYPEGLTGIIPVGGTRTMYILEHNRGIDNPGEIDMDAYANYLLGLYFDLALTFFGLGGQNLIIPVVQYQSFYERGERYKKAVTDHTTQLITPRSQAFYLENNIDIYFVGIDTLLYAKTDPEVYRLGAELKHFQETWTYRETACKIIWEISPIPLFSYWQAHETMGQQAQARLESTLAETSDLREIHDLLYNYYSHAAYGFDLPTPHFYLGSNRNGDLKLRSMMPISLECGSEMRLYYLPYPTLYVTKETLQAILEDLAFSNRLRAKAPDYSGKMTPELVEAEYQRIMALRNDPSTTVGLTRTAGISSED